MDPADYLLVLARLAERKQGFQLEEKFPEPVFKEEPLFLQQRSVA